MSGCRVELLAPTFERDLRALRKYRTLKAAIRQALEYLCKHPGSGEAIVLGMGDFAGGVYKFRFAAENRGKSGAFRLIYYWCEGLIVPLFVYFKGQQSDIPRAEIRKALQALLPTVARRTGGDPS